MALAVPQAPGAPAGPIAATVAGAGPVPESKAARKPPPVWPVWAKIKRAWAPAPGTIYKAPPAVLAKRAPAPLPGNVRVERVPAAAKNDPTAVEEWPGPCSSDSDSEATEASLPGDPGAAGSAELVEPSENLEKRLTTLGLMYYYNHPHFAYFEAKHLQFLHTCLTSNWWKLQGGVGQETLEILLNIFRVLELDRKAQQDFMLLFQSGLVGRTQANKVLWDLLSKWSLELPYEDLSHKVTNAVGFARRSFDRPPRAHPDLVWWTWNRLRTPVENEHFSPLRVPRQVQRCRILMGPGGMPMPPPHCWGPLLPQIADTKVTEHHGVA